MRGEYEGVDLTTAGDKLHGSVHQARERNQPFQIPAVAWFPEFGRLMAIDILLQRLGSHGVTLEAVATYNVGRGLTWDEDTARGLRLSLMIDGERNNIDVRDLVSAREYLFGLLQGYERLGK